MTPTPQNGQQPEGTAGRSGYPDQSGRPGPGAAAYALPHAGAYAPVGFGPAGSAVPVGGPNTGPDGAHTRSGPDAEYAPAGSTDAARKRRRTIPLVPALAAGGALLVIGALAGGAVGAVGGAAIANSGDGTSRSQFAGAGGGMPGSGGPQDSGSQGSGSQDSGAQGGTSPGGTMPGGATQDGAVPGGTIPGGTAPGGTLPGGETQDGGTAGGAMAGGGTQKGGTTGGSMPDGETNDGTMPGGSMSDSGAEVDEA